MTKFDSVGRIVTCHDKPHLVVKDELTAAKVAGLLNAATNMSHRWSGSEKLYALLGLLAEYKALTN